MKNLIYIIALGITWLFSACQDVTVGYLIMDESAGYAKDTMYIVTKAENELQRLKNIKIVVGQEVENEQDELRAQIDDIYNSDEFWDASDEAYAEAEANNPNFWDDTKYAEQVEKELADRFGITPLQEALDNAEALLNKNAIEMGYTSWAILEKQVEEYQNRVDFQLVWATSNIEGIQGTEPLVYTVISVKSEKPENATKFMKCVQAVGKGIMYVDYNPDVPVGTYTVTLQVENEGRTRILKDVFTFVLKDVPTEDPLPEIPEEPEWPDEY